MQFLLKNRKIKMIAKFSCNKVDFQLKFAENKIKNSNTTDTDEENIRIYITALYLGDDK